jgi:hypothetical protein
MYIDGMLRLLSSYGVTPLRTPSQSMFLFLYITMSEIQKGEILPAADFDVKISSKWQTQTPFSEYMNFCKFS